MKRANYRRFMNRPYGVLNGCVVQQARGPNVTKIRMDFALKGQEISAQGEALGKGCK